MAELARHFVALAPAGEAAKAIRYSLAAGAVSSRMCAFEDAVLHDARCLSLVEEDGGAGSERHCDVLIALGEAQLGAGRSAEAAHSLERAAELARARGSGGLLAARRSASPGPANTSSASRTSADGSRRRRARWPRTTRRGCA